MKAKTRTIRAFVRDLCMRGYTNQHIRCIARCTRWVPEISQVKSLLQLRGDAWREKGEANG